MENALLFILNSKSTDILALKSDPKIVFSFLRRVSFHLKNSLM